MKKEEYLLEDGKWVKAIKWKIFKQKIKFEIKRWKLVDKYSNRIVPIDDMKRYFSLSPIEYERAKKIYKEKGTIAYIFYPCGGIAWGVKVRVLDTSEEIDITDVTCW
jgi:hypothetical protein